MKKIIIFGNSGSGKSTLAKQLKQQFNLAHLDLDTLAWQQSSVPQRNPINESEILIDEFTKNYSNWVIEGCYSDLLESVLSKADEIIFLNPGTNICVNNCKARPWEPHKYTSKQEQDKNLEMLIDWVKDYSSRTDEFSLYSHKKLFDNYSGEKTECQSNERAIS